MRNFNLAWNERLEEIREIFEEALNEDMTESNATSAMKSGVLNRVYTKQNVARRQIDADIKSKKKKQSARLDHPIMVRGQETTKGEVLDDGGFEIIQRRAAAKLKQADTLTREGLLDQKMVINYLRSELAKAKSA